MNHSYDSAFADRLPGLDDDALLRTLVTMTATPEGYRPELLAAVKDEVARRNLSQAQQTEVADRLAGEAMEVFQDDAAAMAREGYSVDEMAARLRSHGVGDESATGIAERAYAIPAEQRWRAGRRNVLTGAGMCLIGLGIVASFYYLGDGRLSLTGPYIVFIGTLVVGGTAQVVRGIGLVTRGEVTSRDVPDEQE